MEKNEFNDKIILVTGGTGTIGSELVRQLLTFEPRQVRVLSRDENKQYHLLEELNYPKNLRLLIGDVRDRARLELALQNVDIVLHAAAMKHVSLCEYNPFEAVQTNIIGSQNVIEAALAASVKKVIAISTDKAVGPTNVMGASKLLMEKMFVNVNHFTAPHSTSFACVRFGNVTWASGPVLPLWQRQIEQNARIRVTNNDMTRFLMSTKQAVSLILEATSISRGGEIFLLKMPATKLTELAQVFIAKYYSDKKITIELVGLRPGEKLHEELFDTSDLSKKIFESNRMFIITPHSI